MLILTGFEPFGKYATNPSWEAIKNFEGAEKFEIPVTFKDARRWGERIANINPDFVIATGLSPSTRKIKVEALAVNVMHSEIPDNDGYAPNNEKIYKDGEGCIFTKLPYYKLVDFLNDNGIPARISFSAGTYVCNTLYYSLLHNVGEDKVIFIHVPPTKDITRNCKCCWTLEEIKNAVEKTVEFISRLSSP